MYKKPLLLLAASALALTGYAQGPVTGHAARQPHAKGTAARTVMPKATAPDLQLYGSIIGSFNEPGSYYTEGGDGLYTFNLRTPGAITLVKKDVRTYGGGTYAQGTYYRTDYTESSDGRYINFPIRLYEHSTEDWSQLRVSRGYSFTAISKDMTFDPETQCLYGIFSDADYSGTYRTLGRVRVSTSTEYGYVFDCEPVGTLPEDMLAITANKDGQLYTIGESGMLYRVDKFSATAYTIGETGITPEKMFQSATCDYKTGKIYWATIYNDYWDTGIFEVDPETGTASMVADFGYDNGTGTADQFTGIYLKQDLDLQTLPASVSGLSVTVDNSTKTGEVKFTLPDKDVDGKALTWLGYTVRVNGSQSSTGEASAGAELTAEINLFDDGQCIVSVTPELSATGSQPAAIGAEVRDTIWVGDDAPLAPTEFRAQARGYDVSLSWDAPTKGVHGGDLDASALTYTITRHITGLTDSTVVATGVKGNTYTDHITSTDKASYYYKIVAVNGTQTSAPAQSEAVELGDNLMLPYTSAFDSNPFDEDFDVDDVNDDGTTWYYNETNKSVDYDASTKEPADDWLFTPSIRVKKGAIYHFSFDAKCGYMTERIAAAVGTQPTGTAMTTEVVPTTEISKSKTVTMVGTFRAPEDGTYYFGIHAMSDANAGSLTVDNLSIYEIGTSAPEGVTDFKVTPGAKGANNATVTFTAPVKTLDGNDITGDLTAKIVRDSRTIATLENVKPGAACTYEDASVSTDFHTYEAYVEGSDGTSSVECRQTLFIGLDKPGPIRNFKAVEDLDKEGLIHLTWDAPTEGMNGGYIDPDALTYYVSGGVTGSGDINIGNKTSYDEQLTVNGKQVYQAYSVYAGNDAGNGRSQVWKTASVIAGPALKAPMFESFAGATMKSGPWLTKMTNGSIGEAYCYVVSTSANAVPADEDGGMQSFSSTSPGKSARSESPKVDIRGLKTPTLRFWAYLSGAGDSLTVGISPEYKGFETAVRISTEDLTPGWHAYTVDLTKYKDYRFIQVGFEGKSVVLTEDFVDFDNVAILDPAAHDLMMRSFTAPAELKAGETGSYSVTLRNNATTAVKGSDYQVALIKNGRQACLADGADIAGDGTATLTLTAETSVLDAQQTTCYAVIRYAADENTGNDTSSVQTVKVTLPDYPTPSGLTAQTAFGGISLAWTAPDLTTLKNQSVTDSFDDYEAFAISGYGDWKLVDGDKQKTKRLTLSSIMGPLDYAHAGEAMAFQVFNVEEAGIPFASWDPHSGLQMLVCFGNTGTTDDPDVRQNDDWLISPELDGSAQTVSFYAKAGMSGSYIPERMVFAYSTTGDEVADFTQQSDTINVSNVSGWEEYKFDLPQGAKHFAIHCVSDNKLALMLDDITYIPAGAKQIQLTLSGYNVYRDSVLLNEEPVSGTAYTDRTAEYMHTYNYLVTAVYAEGESLPSNQATAQHTTGISDNTVQTTPGVRTGNGTITVTGADGRQISIYSADGALVTRATGLQENRFPVQPGLYLVSVSGTTHKVLVR